MTQNKTKETARSLKKKNKTHRTGILYYLLDFGISTICCTWLDLIFIQYGYWYTSTWKSF